MAEEKYKYSEEDLCPHEDIYQDVMDMGDDGDGYVAFAFVKCNDCGKSAKSASEMYEE